MTDPTTAMRAAREALHALTDRDFTYLGESVIEASRPLTLTWDEVWRAREAITQLDAALAQPSEEARDAARYRWLRDLRCNSLHLTRDGDHACNYMTAKQWIEEGGMHEADVADTPPNELQRMKDTNTIWRLQVYPNTPIGFNVWNAATLDAAIDAARSTASPQEQSNG